MLYTSYHLKELGIVKKAKIHREANIPLKKVGEFDNTINFCECCNLATEKEGVMEKFKYSDSTDDFVQNGQAISLYFSFYKYSIFILIISFLMISLPCLILSYTRSKELNKRCNDIYTKKGIKNIEECKIYLDQDNNIEDENHSSFNFIVDFSGLNIKNYRIIYGILTNNKNDKFENIFVNYSVLNFICIWALLLIYFGFIILIHNRFYIPDIDIVSPKKYSIMITGMDGFYSYLRKNTNYLSHLNEAEKNDIKTEELKQSSDRESVDEKTISGVKKFEKIFKEKISELFLNNKQNYNIQKVNVCFKINKYMELEEKLEKCEDMMKILENSPYQIQKNEGKMKSQKLYYYSPIFDFNFHICEKC